MWREHVLSAVLLISLIVGILWPLPGAQAYYDVLEMYAEVLSPAQGAKVSGWVTLSGRSVFKIYGTAEGGPPHCVTMTHWHKVT